MAVSSYLSFSLMSCLDTLMLPLQGGAFTLYQGCQVTAVTISISLTIRPKNAVAELHVFDNCSLQYQDSEIVSNITTHGAATLLSTQVLLIGHQLTFLRSNAADQLGGALYCTTDFRCFYFLLCGSRTTLHMADTGGGILAGLFCCFWSHSLGPFNSPVLLDIRSYVELDFDLF